MDIVGQMVLTSPTLEEDRARAKVAEGLVEMGLEPDEATSEANDMLEYAQIAKHFGDKKFESEAVDI